MFLVYDASKIIGEPDVAIVELADAIWRVDAYPEEIIFEVEDDLDPRYVLFGFSRYYPQGGWDDRLVCIESFDMANQVFDLLEEYGKFDYLQLLDLQALEIVRNY